jgi:hypothetical protein
LKNLLHWLNSGCPIQPVHHIGAINYNPMWGSLARPTYTLL